MPLWNYFHSSLALPARGVAKHIWTEAWLSLSKSKEDCVPALQLVAQSNPHSTRPWPDELLSARWLDESGVHIPVLLPRPTHTGVGGTSWRVSTTWALALLPKEPCSCPHASIKAALRSFLQLCSPKRGSDRLFPVAITSRKRGSPYCPTALASYNVSRSTNTSCWAGGQCLMEGHGHGLQQNGPGVWPWGDSTCAGATPGRLSAGVRTKVILDKLERAQRSRKGSRLIGRLWESIIRSDKRWWSVEPLEPLSLWVTLWKEHAPRIPALGFTAAAINSSQVWLRFTRYPTSLFWDDSQQILHMHLKVLKLRNQIFKDKCMSVRVNF